MGFTINELSVGQSASFSKTIGESDIYLFAGVTGDFNPAHVDEEQARDSRFQTRIAHGMLSAGLISSVIGMKLPGPGTIYLNQTLTFCAPVYIGDTITATAEVQSIDYEKKRVVLKTECCNQEGKIVVTGEAVASPPKK